MDPRRIQKTQPRKIHDLNQELVELRQGLKAVQDFYDDLTSAELKREIVDGINREIVRPLITEDDEFECIWQFHNILLVDDKHGHEPLNRMYEVFIYFCSKTGRDPVERPAFEFLLQQMDNPKPLIYRGRWHNCRIRTSAD